MANEIKKLADELVGVFKAEWDESQHPRDEKGRFGSGGGGERGGETDQKLMGLGWRQRDIDAMSDKEKQEKLAAGKSGTLGNGNKGKSAENAVGEDEHRAAYLYHRDEATRLAGGEKVASSISAAAYAHQIAAGAHKRAAEAWHSAGNAGPGQAMYPQQLSDDAHRASSFAREYSRKAHEASAKEKK